MNKHTIGHISKLVGLPAKTIRFYENEGVITPAHRLENGYRAYSDESIEELKLLKYARDLGLPLSEIKKLMKGCDERGCEHSQHHITQSIDSYLGLLDAKIQQMDHLRTKLTELKVSLNSPESACNAGKYCCNILHQLIYLSGKEVTSDEAVLP